jgi:hypothetical protein
VALTNAEKQKRWRDKRNALAKLAEQAPPQSRNLEEPASYAPSYTAADVPLELPEGCGLVHSRNDRMPYVKFGRNGFKGPEGSRDVRVWVEKITDEKHIRCRCSVPCTRFIERCELTGATDYMAHPHWMPRRKVGSAVVKATASRRNAQTDDWSL